MSIHDGHRVRLKKRFLEQGLDSFDDHQALELLLFYALPRIDVNPLAHRLLHHFGGLDRVFEASVEELCQVEGIGENTALLLRLLPQLNRRCNIRQNQPRKTIASATQAWQYLAPYFLDTREEIIYLLCLDNRQRILSCTCLAKGETDCANFSIRRLIETVVSRKAASVILAHNHTSGIALPSADDIHTTRHLKKALDAIGVYLQDHIILAGNDFVSLAASGDLDDTPIFSSIN